MCCEAFLVIDMHYYTMYLLVLLIMTMTPPTNAKNVLGSDLQACCYEPLTGYYRDGYCNTGPRDYGVHTVCAIMTADFLAYTSSCGNDLSTPKPEYNFPGLVPGDKWCLCASRWYEAYKAGVAPGVSLTGTHANTLQIVPMTALQEMAVGE